MSWALAVLAIMVLIVLHELGHFAAAKALGMRVERFSLFFPPTLVSVRRGETEYGIGAIPAGGYVKITGMTPEELREVDLRVAVRGYALQDPWKRVVVILAGPAVNLLVAFAVFWAILASGSINGDLTLSNLNPSVETLTPSTSVLTVARGEPATGVLRPRDQILAVDGHRATLRSARAGIDAHRCTGQLADHCRAATPVRLTLKRGNSVIARSVFPRYSKESRRMLIGFTFGSPRDLGLVAAAGVAVEEMWSTTTNLLSSIGRAFTDEKVRREFHSIVGITDLAQESVTAGAGYAAVFLAFISLVLAVINLFPFLPLDGGHAMWSVAEKLRGRRISMGAMYRFSSVGIVLLLFLVINGVSNDIGRLGG